MEQNERDLEDFLREFRPRQPRALPPVSAEIPAHLRHHHRWHRLAAAILLVIAGSASAWLGSRQNTPTPFPTVLKTAASSKAGNSKNSLPSLVLLERLALEDPAQFDATMSAASRRILQRAKYWEPLPRALAND
jgi:hypothetical protein